MTDKSYTFDVLVIGSGAAGLGLALSLPSHLQIAILSKLNASDGSTYYAQGGISAVLNANDSLESHTNDTIKTGAGLCHKDIVSLVVSHGKECIEWLIQNNVSFSHTNGGTEKSDLHLTKEGGHSHRRVVHASDSTGREVHTSLNNAVKSKTNIQVFEHHNAIDLITSFDTNTNKKRITGCYVLENEHNKIITMQAHSVVLASGGANKVYLYTSNP